MERIERFVVLMYSKTCASSSVNDARYTLFSTGSRSLENIPPTQAALFEHVKRFVLQTCYIWKQATVNKQMLPDFDKWGWVWDDHSKIYLPFWTTLADASKECAILLHCGCTKTCKGNCKCCRAGVRCTSLCKCGGWMH